MEVEYLSEMSESLCQNARRHTPHATCHITAIRKKTAFVTGLQEKWADSRLLIMSCYSLCGNLSQFWGVPSEVCHLRCAIWSVPSEVCHPRCVFKLLGEVSSVKNTTMNLRCAIWGVPSEVCHLRCTIWGVPSEVCHLRCAIPVVLKLLCRVNSVKNTTMNIWLNDGVYWQ